MDCIQCGTHLESLSEACGRCGWHVDAKVNPAALKSVTLAGRYELGNFLGEGRLGAVFIANDLESGHHVAIKVIHPGLIPDDGIGGEFLNGMRPLMTITHPVMTRIFDVNRSDGRYFIVGNNYTNFLDRNNLLIALSHDGRTFDRQYTLRSGRTTRRINGRHKEDGYHYPNCLVDGDKLLVIHSVNKEDIEVCIVDMSRVD